MDLFIRANGVQRHLVADAYAICGSRQDLGRLAVAINKMLAEGKTAYGWVEVYDSVRSADITLSWDEATK